MTSLLGKSRLAAIAMAAPVLFGAGAGPKLTLEQTEKFLREARIVSSKNLSAGSTNSQRARLNDGSLEHDAHVQCIDEAKTRYQGTRATEMNFRDTWKFNIAGYRLGRILELDMIPVSVERKVNVNVCAVTWWLDDSITEMDRMKKKLEPADKGAWNQEMYVVRVFDQLIYNTDRNPQNLLIDRDWHIWMIDHTRAFRMYLTVKEMNDLVRCDRQLLHKIRSLNAESLGQLKPYVTDLEIRGLLARRNLIVKFFDDQIKQRGEAAVLYDRPPR